MLVVTAFLVQFLINPVKVSAAPPVVTTNAAAGITMSSAVLSGVLNSLGTSVSANVSFDWGLNTAYGSNIPATPNPVVSANQTVSANLNGLAANTTYHFRVRAMGINGEGSLGADRTFTTSRDINVLFEANNSTNVINDRAHVGFYTAQTFTPQVSHYIKEFRLVLYNETTNGTLTGSLRNVDAIGQPTGPDLITSPPIIESGMPPYATMTFTFDFSITNPNGYLLQAGTRYALVIHSTVGGQVSGTGLMVSLSNDINRYTRGQYLSGSDGATWNTSYTTTDLWFEEWGTAAGTAPPAVTTNPATSVTMSSAVLNGVLNTLGTSTSANVTFDWGLDTNYGSVIPATPATIVSSNQTFTASLNGLAGGRTYHFRARANGLQGAGSGTGADRTFTTLADANTVFENVPNINSESHLGYYAAQTFIPRANHYIREFRVYLRNETAAGILTGSLRNVDSTGAPSGNDLIISPPINESGMPPNVYSLVTFDFSVNNPNGYLLQAGTRYALVIHSTVGDDANGHGIMIQDYLAASAATDIYPGGQWVASADGSNWNLGNSLVDISFTELGVAAAPAPYILTVNTAGNGTGIITARANGQTIISGAQVLSGSTVTLTAAPNSGNTFAGWSSADIYITNPSGNPLTLVMPAKPAAVTATFIQGNSPGAYLVTTRIVPTQAQAAGCAVTGNIGGYSANAPVSLSATAAAGWIFNSWTSDDILNFNANTNPLSFLMPAKAVTVMANFNIYIPPISGGGGGGNENAYTPPPPPPPAPLSFNGLTSSADLNLDFTGHVQNGVQLQTEDGNATLDIPRGTVLCDAYTAPLTNLTAALLDNPPEAAPRQAVIVAYEFGPDGSYINPPITLTLSLGAIKLPEGAIADSIVLAHWDGKQWVKVDSQINSAAGTFTIQIGRFGRWALIAAIAPLPKFSQSDLQLSADNVAVDDNITIQARVNNTGEANGKYTAVLKINNEITDSQELTLAAGASRELVFNVSRGFAGDYTIDINGKTAQFTVIEISPAVPEPGLSLAPEPGSTPEFVFTPAMTPAQITPSLSQEKLSNQTVMWLVVGIIVALSLVTGVVTFRSRH